MDVTNNSTQTPNLLPQPLDLIAQQRLDIETTWAGLIRDLPVV